MSNNDETNNLIVIDLRGMHPTYVRQARRMQKQIESWFGWRHIAFVLELVDSGQYLDGGGGHVWFEDKAKRFATKAEAVSWCGDRHVDRGGIVTVQSLVEKDGELKTLALVDDEHAMLEAMTTNPQGPLRQQVACGVDEGHGDMSAIIILSKQRD